MKVHAAAAKALAECGVEAVFGVMGDGNMYLVGDYARNGVGRYYGSVTESGACSMAQGYARVSGKVGVATVTHGPGAANTLNPVTEAARCRTPFVLITGTTPSRRHHHQDIDLRVLFAATGAHYARVLQASDAVDDVARVLHRAGATSGPVILDIPFDIHQQDVEYEPPVHLREPPPAVPSADDLDDALGRIASSDRPLVLAGRGAVDSGARDELIRLADVLGAPLATTASANGLFAGHPYDLGIMGSCGLPWAVDVMTESDCVIAFGAGLNPWTTYDGDILRRCAVVHCDIDRSRLGFYHTPDYAIAGDAAATARLMCERLELAEVEPKAFRRRRVGEGGRGRDPRAEFTDASGDGVLDMRTAMVLLDQCLPADRLVVTDGGRFVPVPWRYLRVADARSFVHTYRWGSIGLGAPTAIGAAVARPNALSVCVAGDGGGMMAVIEFSTAVRYDLPFLMIVLNDAAYGAEYDKFKTAGFDPEICFNDWPEFAGIADGLGGRGVTVRSEAELVSAIEDLPSLGRQVLIDIKCDPHVDYAAA